jgi:hypothetical protein
MIPALAALVNDTHAVSIMNMKKEMGSPARLFTLLLQALIIRHSKPLSINYLYPLYAPENLVRCQR